jgi:hypothetical protein
MHDIAATSPPEGSMPRPGLGTPSSALVRNRAYGLVSLLLLLPVYWQPRVQAGDLSSHIYNAWLAQLIETGKAQGLVVSQANTLFDLILGALFRVGGAEFAQRISVSLAVLTFVWGAFAFVSAVSGRKPWHLMPAIAMLAYGWVFHMGFFNFYLSLGLCFWALSVAWELKLRRMAIAAPLLVLAYTAHALPVVWTAGLLLYLWLASRISPRRRVYATAAWLMAMVALNAVVGRPVFLPWSLQQIKMTIGADQARVFDGKYHVVLVGLLLIWGLMFIRLLRKSGMEYVVSSIPFQFCVIGAAAVFILPTTILIPGFHHTLVYIAERMSLGVGVCICALLGAAVPRVFERYALLVVAMVFFVFLYRDERALNSFEDRMSDPVAQLAPWHRPSLR